MKKKNKLFILVLSLMMALQFVPVYANDNNEVTKVYTITIDDLNSPRYSVTHNRSSGEKNFKDTKNNITMSCSATLTVVIRENISTGVITSYEQPVLNVYNCYASGFEVFAEKLDTSKSELTSGKTTLKCVGTFNIYARSGTGIRMATSKQFKIEFIAG